MNTYRHLFDRRRFLAAASVSGAMTFCAPALRAGSYPDHPVRITVPFGAGGIGDITIRIVADRLGAKLGPSFIVDNMPGPGGITAARAAIQGGKDGYTLALFSNGTAVSVGLFNALRFDPVKDFAPISSLGSFEFVLATGGESRFKSFADFVTEARAKPGVLNVGTIAIGSTQNLSAELLKSLGNIDFRIIPYRNTPDIVLAAQRGDVDLLIDSYATMQANFADNKLRPLATSSGKRSLTLPNIPTVAEAGVEGYDVTSWNALFAPAGTSPDVIATLNKAIVDVLAVPETKARMLELGIEAKASTPDEIEERLKADIAKWSALIEKAGIEKQ